MTLKMTLFRRRRSTKKRAITMSKDNTRCSVLGKLTGRRRRRQRQVQAEHELRLLREKCQCLQEERDYYCEQNGVLSQEVEALHEDLQQERALNDDLVNRFVDAGCFYTQIGPVQPKLVLEEKNGTTVVGDYQLECELGRGSFGQVWLATNKKDEQQVAIKVLEKRKKHLADLESVNTEVEVLRRYSHPNIIGFHGVLHSKSKVYLVLEKADVNLYDVLQNESTQPDLAKQVILGTLRALAHLHRQGVAHGDLSLGNILVANYEEGMVRAENVRLCDFGYSSTPSNPNFHSHGTPGFHAPEKAYHDENFDPKIADMWSVGIVLLLCRYGSAGLVATQWMHQCHQKLRGDQDSDEFYYDFQKCLRDVQSLGRRKVTNYEDEMLLQNLLCQDLLQMNPDRRATSSQALRHPWFSS